ncbi:MAG: hypothetical protein IJ457_06990 [Clostridia bacterium]|nr:hypothetical protein [Clostridia bacterium]
MKKLISIFTAALLVAALSSCSSKSPADTKAPIVPSGEISVNLPDKDIMYTENFKVTDKMIAYLLRETYSSFCDGLAELGLSAADLGIVPGQSLGSQSCAVDASVKSWLEYFAVQAEFSFTEQLVLCEAAKAEGIALDDSDNEKIDGALNELYRTARLKGMSESAYIASVYGSTVTAGDITSALRLSYLAEKYLRAVSDSADTSHNALENYYAQYQSRLDTADFLVYVFAAGETEYAEALAAQKTRDDFLEYIRYYTTEVRGLTEDEFLELKDEHIVNTNVSKDDGDEVTSFAFSANTGDVRLIRDGNSSALTVVMVTRSGGRNESLDENGVPMWEARARALIEEAAVDSAKKAAAEKFPVTADRQAFYSIDIIG